MSGRGMKKWMPFSSLEDQKASLCEMKHRKGRSPKPLISSERAEKIDFLLRDYQGKLFDIQHYEDGYVLSFKSSIERVCIEERKIITATKTIAFSDLLDLNVL